MREFEDLINLNHLSDALLQFLIAVGFLLGAGRTYLSNLLRYVQGSGLLQARALGGK